MIFTSIHSVTFLRSVQLECYIFLEKGMMEYICIDQKSVYNTVHHVKENSPPTSQPKKNTEM
jgi:hypothetical protein